MVCVQGFGQFVAADVAAEEHDVLRAPVGQDAMRQLQGAVAGSEDLGAGDLGLDHLQRGASRQ